uniref:Uncharacterized protein n=1 Tax=Anguilla anguilla TaxID=7936 RepID=A0A0E9QRZ6_ANGAN
MPNLCPFKRKIFIIMSWQKNVFKVSLLLN